MLKSLQERIKVHRRCLFHAEIFKIQRMLHKTIDGRGSA